MSVSKYDGLVEVVVGALIINTQGQVLLVKSHKWGGQYVLPGGHVEFGETLLECAKRELMEETGIVATQLKLIAITDNIDQERGQYVHASFLITHFIGEISNCEPQYCHEWRFFDLSQLPENIFNPHKKILQTYRQKVIYLNNE